MTPRELAQRARGLVLLAQTDVIQRQANADVSDGDGSVKCAVCDIVQRKGEPFVFIFVGGAFNQRVVCGPCIGACVGAEAQR